MPFAGYTDFDDCVAKNKDKGNPQAYCGTIKNKVEEALQEAIKEAGSVGIASRNCYDWEGYEIDCDSGKRIGPGHSQSKAYKKFLNETLPNIKEDVTDPHKCNTCGHENSTAAGAATHKMMWPKHDVQRISETDRHIQEIIRGYHQYLNSSTEIKETMETPKRLCECQDIKEIEKYLDDHKASKAQRNLVGLAVRMTDPTEKKKTLEFVENDIKETEGSHQSDGDTLPSPPGAKAQQNSHEMPGKNQYQEAEFDMTTCVSNAIANGASPEQARAQCSAKQGTMEMIKEALKPHMSKFHEATKDILQVKEAITALDTKFQETVKAGKGQKTTIEFVKTAGPGGAVRETTGVSGPQTPHVKSATELMDARRDIISENDRLSDGNGSVYQ